MKSHKTLIFVAIVAFAIGMLWSSGGNQPPDRPSRPVLTWIARAAKSLLWIAVFADPPPAQAAHIHQADAGEDGYLQVNHCEAW